MYVAALKHHLSSEKRESTHMSDTDNPSNRTQAIRATVLIVVVVVIIGGLTADFIIKYTGSSTQICTVNSKDRSTNRDGNSNTRVYTDQCGVFSVEDRFFAGYVDSADVYAQIQVGKTYELHTTGRRVPIMSAFPNITSASEVTE